jgi:hypothetical protein
VRNKDQTDAEFGSAVASHCAKTGKPGKAGKACKAGKAGTA